METLSENNSNEMKTQVQTYLIEETEALIYDNEQLEKWGDLVKSLGLEGQQKIQQPGKSPIPFLCLNQIQVEILSTLCPITVEIKGYNKSPIPVEILDLVALSTKEGYFQKIEVWYDDKDPDPAVIGFCGYWQGDDANGKTHQDGNGNALRFLSKTLLEEYRAIHGGKGKWSYFHTAERYILGRWADVKEDFSQLAKRAKERFISFERNAQEKIIKEAQRRIEEINNRALDNFGV